MAETDRIVFIHSSDELYGADRILLDIFASLTPPEREAAEFWLPTDVPHAAQTLCAELESHGATVRHLDLPVLRRAYRTPLALLRLARKSVTIWRRLRASRATIVYLSTSATYLCAPAARLAKVPCVVGHKQELWSGADARALALLARACHRLVAISGPVRDNLPVTLQARTALVLNATRVPASYQPLEGREGPLQFLVASRWNAWKGHRTLLAAWDRLTQPAELVVLGGSPPSGEAVDVPALVAALRDPDRVTIVGEVADIGPYLDAADVMVVPSDDPEPFGLVAIEAFARGRPVIASAAGGLADIVTDGHDGWTFPLRDVDALAGVLERLDRNAVASAGAAARATYESRFTPERYAADWRAAVGL